MLNPKQDFRLSHTMHTTGALFTHFALVLQHPESASVNIFLRLGTGIASSGSN